MNGGGGSAGRSMDESTWSSLPWGSWRGVGSTAAAGIAAIFNPGPGAATTPGFGPAPPTPRSGWSPTVTYLLVLLVVEAALFAVLARVVTGVLAD